MELREWALITFTILGQLAAGALLVIMVIRALLASKAKTAEIDGLLDGPLFIVVPVMGLALLASLLHLNNLANVVKAVPNLGSSWLSREVVISVVFVVLAVIYTFMQWRKMGGNSLRTVLGWITALVGVAQTYAMAQVYMIRTEPAWNTLATPVTFFVTYLLLGGLAVAAAMVIGSKGLRGNEPQSGMLRGVLQGIALVAVILLGIQFLVLPVYLAYLGTQGPAAQASLGLMVGPFLNTLVLRLVLIFVGAGLLGTYLYRNAGLAGKEKTVATMTYGAFILVLVAEVMGRVLFYATHIRTGL